VVVAPVVEVEDAAVDSNVMRHGKKGLIDQGCHITEGFAMNNCIMEGKQ
jgi:hypothetical protein